MSEGTLLSVGRSKKLQTPRNRIERELAKMRLFDLTFRMWHHHSFDDPTKAQEIMAPMPDLEAFNEMRRTSKAPPDATPEIASLYAEPLLDKEQEFHLFRQMNFLKYRAKRMLSARSRALRQIESILRDVVVIRKQIVASNMRLAFDEAIKCAGRNQMHKEGLALASDANISVIKAADCFDWTRGFKFSTYACNAIQRNLWRDVEAIRKPYLHERYGADDGFDENFFEGFAEGDFYNDLFQRERNTFIGSVVDQLLSKITIIDNGNSRRADIMRMFCLGTEKQTLKVVAKSYGISKERVRQLNSRTMLEMEEMLRSGEVSLNGISKEFIKK